ncbi:putative 2OG-Fe(II) oxygenase [Lysobacter sp. Root604]|uniref:putative 2OG-Fe(II) oxygenase n=1 Tax=Lysobacter sp. Root604 TaxID=1736568 RepID=UPI0006FC8AF6|nr:putative 2OG-Fe(II) oxygenase [Lysobacter sp. Root604]KRA16936.1 hypothetical protein ASD69_09340 [Lysobacter sp. Root604]
MNAVAGLLREAYAALQRGDAAQARLRCEAVFAQDPNNFDAWRMLAVAAQALGDAPRGLAAATRAQQLRPDDGPAALDLGTRLLHAGQAAAAAPLLQLAMQRLPQDARAAFRYANAAFQLGDYATAAAGFAAATERDPNWPEAWNNLSAAHSRLQEYPQAIAAARNALRLAPQDPEAHQALAVLLSNLFDRPSLLEGLRSAERALQLDPNLAAAHRNAAVLLRKLGEPVRAEAHARRALQLQPDHTGSVEILGDQLILNGRGSDAAAIYADAIGRGLDTPVLQRQHGIALLHAGRAQAAHEQLSAALRQQGDDQRSIAHLGVALAADGRVADAVDLLGLQRHIHAIDLAPPPAYADAAAFHAELAQDIRRHSQQRWEPAGLAARQAYLSGDLLADRTPAIVGFEQRLRAAIDAFISDARQRQAGTDAHDDVFLRNVPLRYRLHVWATQAAESGYIDTHIHEDSWLSGAYYVELPEAIADAAPDQADPDPDHAASGHAGWIEFGRPYAGLPQWPADALRLVRPQVGRLLLFPSYVFHRTLPYQGSGERISISFDLAAA